MLIDFSTLQKYNIIPRGVIHVGMHKAEEYPLYKNAGVNSIIFIEANKTLVDNYAPNDKHCHVIHAAISNTVEEVEFNITNNGESSSILELADHAEIYPSIVNIQKIKILTSTLDSVLQTVPVNIKNFNILNLDIQGVELKAMMGLSNWSNIEAVFTEVNYREMYKGCSLINEIDTFLKVKNFKKVEEVNTGSGWGDALYIKDLNSKK